MAPRSPADKEAGSLKRVTKKLLKRWRLTAMAGSVMTGITNSGHHFVTSSRITNRGITGASLTEAPLIEASLIEASLTGAYIIQASLIGH